MERIEPHEKLPRFGPIELDLESKSVRLTGTNKSESLSQFEYQILWILVRAKGGFVPRSDIESFIYSDIADDKDLPLGNSFDVKLHSLRRKLHNISDGKIIIGNIIRGGYAIAERRRGV
ncbi:MAG: winged helix-turn-helix domain-containing protein [bacterium]|nr:winged helix-turn-helix domain-containing protein [bacterium]